MLELLHHQVALDDVESRTEVDKEQSGEVARGFQVSEEGVEEACDSILCTPPSLVGKRVSIELWG